MFTTPPCGRPYSAIVVAENYLKLLHRLLRYGRADTVHGVVYRVRTVDADLLERPRAPLILRPLLGAGPIVGRDVTGGPRIISVKLM